MRQFRVLAPFFSALLFAGCGYVHFGQASIQRAADEKLKQAHSDLAMEQKILKQELVLARRETDTLRAALEAGAAPGVSEAARQLETTARELSELRASYAKLQADRLAANPGAAIPSAMQEENARLKRELEASRIENARLADKLKASVAENEQSQAALAQLDQDLRAQQRARERAEQATQALRAQLDAVMARASQSAPATSEPEAPRQPPVSSLQLAREPASGTAPTFEFRTNLARVRAAAAATSAGEPPTISPESETALVAPPAVPPAQPSVATTVPQVPERQAESAAPQASPAPEPASARPSAAPVPTPAPKRTYVVQAGDTLEKISTRLYGAADQWTKIYSANASLLNANQGLKPGMELQVP